MRFQVKDQWDKKLITQTHKLVSNEIDEYLYDKIIMNISDYVDIIIEALDN